MTTPPEPRDTRSLAQQGCEAFIAEMRAQGIGQREWHEVSQAHRDAWAVAVDAIIDAWEDLQGDPPPTRGTS